MTRRYPETDMYEGIKEWKDLHMHLYPSLSRLYHIDNEGKRKPWVAAKSGIVSGVSDYHYAARTDQHVGLYLEIKYGKNKLTPNQRLWLEESREYGFQAEWCNTLQSTFMVLETYAKQVEAYKRRNHVD